MRIIRWTNAISTWFHDTSRAKAWRIVKAARQRWTDVDGDQRSAAFAFYLVLSLFPIAVLLVSAGSLFVEREVVIREFISWADHYTPMTPQQRGDALSSIQVLFDSRGKINVTAVAILVWGALKFLRALIRTTNRIWQSPTYSWWRLPLKSLGLLGITASAASIGILLPAAARFVRNWFTSYLGFPKWTFELVFSIIPWLVLFYGIVMVYKMASSRRTGFSEVWIGALVVTVLLWLGGILFLVYATNIANFNVLYGSLGGIVAFLLWVYLSSSACVFGICLNAARAEARPPTSGAPDHSFPPNTNLT
jgi:YihY family inner membrane protein